MNDYEDEYFTCRKCGNSFLKENRLAHDIRCQKKIVNNYVNSNNNYNQSDDFFEEEYTNDNYNKSDDFFEEEYTNNNNNNNFINYINNCNNNNFNNNIEYVQNDCKNNLVSEPIYKNSYEVPIVKNTNKEMKRKLINAKKYESKNINNTKNISKVRNFSNKHKNILNNTKNISKVRNFSNKHKNILNIIQDVNDKKEYNRMNIINDNRNISNRDYNYNIRNDFNRNINRNNINDNNRIRNVDNSPNLFNLDKMEYRLPLRNDIGDGPDHYHVPVVIPIERSRGLDDKSIKNYPISKIHDISTLSEDKKKCLVCLENFKNGDYFITLPCIHIFHAECIKKWMKQQNFCPICKNIIKI